MQTDRHRISAPPVVDKPEEPRTYTAVELLEDHVEGILLSETILGALLYAANSDEILLRIVLDRDELVKVRSRTARGLDALRSAERYPVVLQPEIDEFKRLQELGVVFLHRNELGPSPEFIRGRNYDQARVIGVRKPLIGYRGPGSDGLRSLLDGVQDRFSEARYTRVE